MKSGVHKVPDTFYAHLKTRLVARDAYYSDFGPIVLKKTLMYFGEAVMARYSTTDKAIVDTSVVRKAWKSVKDFVSLVALNHCSLYDTQARRYGAPVETSSNPSTNTSSATPASTYTANKTGLSNPSGTILPVSKPPSTSDTTPLRTTTKSRGTITTLILKRKPANTPTSSAKQEKRARQDPVVTPTKETASRPGTSQDTPPRMAVHKHKVLEKTVKNRDPKKRTEAVEVPFKTKTNKTNKEKLQKENQYLKKPTEPVNKSSKTTVNGANEAKLPKKNPDPKDQIESMEGSPKANKANETKLQKENQDLKNQIEAMEESHKAREAKLQEQLLLKVMEAAGLEADNQRIKETGPSSSGWSSPVRLWRWSRRRPGSRVWRRRRGGLRRRVEELEAVQRDAARAKGLSDWMFS